MISKDKKTILLMDDRWENFFALDIMFKQTEIKTIQATSGREALLPLHKNDIDLNEILKKCL